jgi:glycosyltransferase involved in cell wall biosynthesis
MKPVVFGGFVARLLGMRRVVQAVPGLGYGFVGDGLAGRLRRALLIGALRLSCRWPGAAVILQNAEDLDTLVHAGAITRESAILVRGSGVAVSAITPRPEPPEPVRVVLASRMLREKGVAEFVEAARQLRDAGVRAEFLLAGEPDGCNPGSISAEQLADWDRSGAIRYLGFVKNIPDLLLSSHLACLPTYYGEGVPKILIEAAACGRAIVTTDRPGCRDIVRDGLNGLLVQPRNSAALADALRRLIRSTELRHEYGAAGRRLAAAEFDLSIIVTQTLALYERLLEEPCASS